MTIKELYYWAKVNGCENAELEYELYGGYDYPLFDGSLDWDNIKRSEAEIRFNTITIQISENLDRL